MKLRAYALEISSPENGLGSCEDEHRTTCGLEGRALASNASGVAGERYGGPATVGDDESAAGICDEGCGEEPLDDRYEESFRRVIARIDEHEAEAAWEATGAGSLFDGLMRLSPGERERTVRKSNRFVSHALAERLLEACADPDLEDRADGATLARLALAVADRLDPHRYGAGAVSDLKARAWAHLGRRWADSAPAAAGEAFRLAVGHLMRGSGDPLAEAELQSLCAEHSARTGIVLERDGAGSIYETFGESPRLGDLLARKARISGEVGEHVRAVEALCEVLTLLGDVAPPLTLAELSSDLAHHLVCIGRPEEAWEEIGRARSFLVRTDRSGGGACEGMAAPPLLRLRLCWLEGRVAAALALDDEARSRLEEAREGFLATGQAREAVLAHLDLAALSARSDGEGYDRAMDRLADETPRVLAGADLPRESATALLLVEQAARQRALRPDLVQAVTGLLDRVA